MFVKIVRTINGKRIEKSFECDSYDITPNEREGRRYLTVECSPRGQLFALDEVAGNEIYIMNSDGKSIEIWRFNSREGRLYPNRPAPREFRA